jgi:protease I
MKALVPVAFETQDEEWIYPYYRLQEYGFEVTLAHIGEKPAVGKYGIKMPVNQKGAYGEYDLIVVPGGWGAEILRSDGPLLSLIKKHHDQGKVIGAICHGPWVLISAGLVKGRNISAYPGMKDDVLNAGGVYSQDGCRDKNIVSFPHYKYNADFMKMTLKVYEEWSK